MKPIIEAFAPSHISDDWWQHIVISKGGGDAPLTILPGHLAEMLRWRKVGEVPAHLTGGLYVVSRLGLCRLEESSFDEGAFNWIAGSGDYPVEDYETYRPAIAGIDYVEGV